MSSLVSFCISPLLPFSASVFCLLCYCIQLHRLAQRGAVRAQFLNSSYSTMLLHQSQISNQSTAKAMASFQVYIYISIYFYFFESLIAFFFIIKVVFGNPTKNVLCFRGKKKCICSVCWVFGISIVRQIVNISFLQPLQMSKNENFMKYFISHSLFFFCFLIFMHLAHKNYKKHF